MQRMVTYFGNIKQQTKTTDHKELEDGYNLQQAVNECSQLQKGRYGTVSP